MEVITNYTSLAIIEYPGIVNNITNVLKTLNGIDHIEKIHQSSKKRLELRFRPEDPFCKPVHGDRYKTKSLVIKVRCQKQKQGVDRGNCTVEVLGYAKHLYKFESLCDFQYLPAINQNNGTFRSIINDVYATGLKHSDWISHGSNLLFLLPQSFSRIDNISFCWYGYREGPWTGTGCTKDSEKNLLPGSDSYRKPRESFTYFVNFDDGNEVPSAPHPTVLDRLKEKHPQFISNLKTVQMHFEQRPIWSRTALSVISGISPDELKFLLPCVAFNYLTGPWRTLWVKFGYDPRIDPTAKQYQVLDFRIGHMHWLGEKAIKCKRNEARVHLPGNTSMKYRANRAAYLDRDSSYKSATFDDQPSQREAYYKYKPGFLPPYRQMFYQLCDVEVDEVQALVHANDGKESKCTDLWGFCEPGVQKQSRDILGMILTQTMGLNETISKYYMAKVKKNKHRSVKHSIDLPGTSAAASTDVPETSAQLMDADNVVEAEGSCSTTAVDPAEMEQSDEDAEDDSTSDDSADEDVGRDELALTDADYGQLEKEMLDYLDI